MGMLIFKINFRVFLEKGFISISFRAIFKDERKKRHSGTGRIARLRMHPMALCESDLACG